MNDLIKKTCKELRDLAKELNIKGRWDMNKNELVNAINDSYNNKENENSSSDKKTTYDYLQNIEEGTLVAFKRSKNKDVAMSGKFVSFEDGKIVVESKKGTMFRIDKENILWVKTGLRWPKWVFNLFNKKSKVEEQEVECDNAIS